MAESADAADSKSAEGNLVGVRPPLPAPQTIKTFVERLSTRLLGALRAGPTSLGLCSAEENLMEAALEQQLADA